MGVGSAVKGLSSAIGSLPAQMWRGIAGGGTAAAGAAAEAAKKPRFWMDGFFLIPRKIVSGVGSVFGASAKAGLATVGWVVAVPIHALRMGVTGVGNLFQHAPWVAWPVTGLVGATWMFGGTRRSAEQRTRREILEQMGGGYPMPQMSYKNTVTPAETALLDARLGEGKPQGFAAAQTAARAAAATEQASASAK